MPRTFIAALAIAVAALAVVPEAAPPPAAQDDAPERVEADLRAMEAYRPGYAFWQHVFTITDGWIAFGSGVDGRLLAAFPVKGDWKAEGVWHEPSLASLLDRETLPRTLDERRDFVASLLEPIVGQVVHNPTRGQFLLPNARRYGQFLSEWAAIYERFGVPARIGLAQAAIESGFNGTRRSEARAVGFCQWLERNWRELNRLSGHVIESGNQTTQAPYCAAYLSILATKYGSFIPALSEHHSGGTNVGRTLINGERLGGADIRDRYFLGGQFARDLRQIDLYGYRDIYRTYGPRSYLYAEMVFGNTFTVTNLIETTPQARIYAMRTPRAIRLTDITRRTGLSADEVRRYNPALSRQVPARATLYLPRYVKEFGADVAFWHQEPTAAYADVLEDFLELDGDPETWDSRAFEPVLRGFQKRFRATATEEGRIMAAVLEYAMKEAYTSGRPEIIAEFRASEGVRELFARGLLERASANLASLRCEETEQREARAGSC